MRICTLLSKQIIHLCASHLLTGDVLQVFLHHDLSEAHLDQPFCALSLCGPVDTDTNTFIKNTFNTFTLSLKKKKKKQFWTQRTTFTVTVTSLAFCSLIHFHFSLNEITCSTRELPLCLILRNWRGNRKSESAAHRRYTTKSPCRICLLLCLARFLTTLLGDAFSLWTSRWWYQQVA